MNPWYARHAGPVDDGADQFQLLTLCLELQLDLLLVALRSETGTTATTTATTTGSTAGWPRWDGETLDLTGLEPGGVGPAGVGQDQATGEPGRDRLEARLAGIAAAIDELLATGEVKRHPSVVARLLEARATCEERLAALPRPVPAAVPVEVGVGRVEPGHFLG